MLISMMKQVIVICLKNLITKDEIRCRYWLEVIINRFQDMTSRRVHL